MKFPIKTVEGEFVAHYSRRGLRQLDFPGSNRPVENEDKDVPSAKARRWHSITTKALNEVLAGHDARTMPPLDLSVGTDFQQKVWNAMLEIKSGKTRSYAELAAGLRKPGAARAVGGACGANPIPVLIPCHRVLAANQRLGGFSSGLPWKRKLLALEGVAYSEITPLLQFAGS